MTDVLLSAALIVRDEARHLEACLLSIRELVDEMVVVDTGSSDGTPELARRLGARVSTWSWRGDFAAARNAALARCRGAWILYIDADERMRPTAAEPVRTLLRPPHLVGCYVWLHAHAGCTAYREMRLFRNDPCIRFEGVIHENIWPGLQRYMVTAGGAIGQSELILDHVGYEGDQTHKHHRNLPLLLQKLEQDPEHAYSWWHLGAVYRGLGEVEHAREAWRAGLAVARRRQTRQWADSLSFIGLIELDFAKREEADGLLEEAWRRYPDHPHLVWLRGKALMRDGHFPEAIVVLQELLAWQTRPRVTDGIVGADERLFRLFPAEALATCYFRLGQYAESARYYALAEQYAPDQIEYRVKRQLAAHLASRGQPERTG